MAAKANRAPELLLKRTVAQLVNKPDMVQVRNPMVDRWVKIDRSTGVLVSTKKSKGPYKKIPVAKRKP